MTNEQRWDQAFEMGPNWRPFGQDWDWGNFPPYRKVDLWKAIIEAEGIGILHLPTVIHEGPRKPT